MNELLSMIILWLSFNVGLPITDEHPHIEFLSAQNISKQRHTIISSVKIDGADSKHRIEEVTAFYNDQTRTIYLSDTWSPESAVDISVLVHELVHHLQNMAAMKYPCPAKREELAYRAQDEWLSLFGKNLSSELGLDPLTLLVRTECLH